MTSEAASRRGVILLVTGPKGVAASRCCRSGWRVIACSAYLIGITSQPTANDTWLTGSSPRSVPESP